MAPVLLSGAQEDLCQHGLRDIAPEAGLDDSNALLRTHHVCDVAEGHVADGVRVAEPAAAIGP
jgi:hypothetical protein